MTIETATYISDLNAANPGATDVIPEGDDHIRLIKSTVKTTFPNVSGAVTPTHTVINNLAAGTFPGVAVTGVTNLTMTGNLSVQGNTTVGDAAGDALTVNPNAVTWSNNPTHSGNHTYSGNLSVQGNTTLGNAGTDSVTVNGNTTLNAPSAGSTLTATQFNTAAVGVFTSATSGVTTEVDITNTSNTASSQASLFMAVGGATAGDPFTRLDITAVQSWSYGIDNSDSDTFKFDATGALTTASNRFNIATDGRIYGTAIHNSAGSVTGTTNQYVASLSGLTPTSSATTNCSVVPRSGGTTAVRVGNVVMVAGYVDVDPTAASTATQFSLSLPIASNFTGGLELAGSAAQIGPTTAAGFATLCSITADVTNDVAVFSFFCGTDAANRTWTYNYQYVIV